MPPNRSHKDSPTFYQPKPNNLQGTLLQRSGLLLPYLPYIAALDWDFEKLPCCVLQMADETFLFTSESVNEGHPDKMCDQVSKAGSHSQISGCPCTLSDTLAATSSSLMQCDRFARSGTAFSDGSRRADQNCHGWQVAFYRQYVLEFLQ